MGVQSRPYAVPNHMTQSPPSIIDSMASATSHTASRKRRNMDDLLTKNNDEVAEDADLSQRVSFKRSKSGEATLRVHVRASSPSLCAASQPCSPASSSPGASSSPSSSKVTRPNMSASQTITLDMLRPHFEKPLAQVAQVFGICVTLLKKICRKNGLARWPHRQIIGLRKSIASMEQAIDHFDGARRESYAQQLDKQRCKLTALLDDPTTCNLHAVDDVYTPPSHPVEDYARATTPAYPQTQAPYYPAYAPPAPTYERQYGSYAPHPPQMSYYHHAAPPAQPVAYQAYHHYSPPVSHPARPMPQATPQLTLPPLRIENRRALPSLSALVGRRW